MWLSSWKSRKDGLEELQIIVYNIKKMEEEDKKGRKERSRRKVLGCHHLGMW